MRNLTDKEAEIYDNWLNAEAEDTEDLLTKMPNYTIDDICKVFR